MKKIIALLTVLFVFVTSLACGISGGNTDVTNNAPDSIFSTEPSNNDIKNIWESQFESGGNNSEESYEIIQIWENRRQDYYVNVSFDVVLYATDGSILKSDSQTVTIGANSSRLIRFDIQNDTGSKSKNVDVVITYAEWVPHNNSSDQQQLAIVQTPAYNPDGIPVPEVLLEVRNNSNFAVSNIEVTYMMLSMDDIPVGIFSSVEIDEIAYEQNETLTASLFPFFWDWVNSDPNLSISGSKVKLKYWVDYVTYVGEPVTLSGSTDLEIPNVQSTPTISPSSSNQGTTPGLYNNPSAGISLTYPTSWQYSESGDTLTGYSIKFSSSPDILNNPSLPETGASLMIGTRYATTSDVPFTINTSSMVDVLDWIASASNPNLGGGEKLRNFTLSGYPAASGIYTITHDTGAPTTVYVIAVLRDDKIIAFFGICPQTEWSQYQSIFDSIINSVSIVTP